MQTVDLIPAEDINLDVYCALIAKGMDADAALEAAMAAAGCELIEGDED